ncbi:MAG: hypothetical protein K2X32_15740 [Phycisphaerales bacterium]|nr:hypothetical protein [Phycisphaerales bacterium]
MLTLWDLIEPAARRILPGLSRPAKVAPPVLVAPPAPRPQQSKLVPLAPAAPPVAAATKTAAPRRRARVAIAKPVDHAAATPPAAQPSRTESAQETYDRVVQLMLTTHNIRVKRWRTAMSGVAWYVEYRDGTISRLLESPKPKGPMSMAIFLHEVGHHAIGFNRYKPRCLEEYHAWRWSLDAMEAQGLNITDSVRYRMHLSLWYAVSKARRRGLKVLPDELAPFTERPAKIRATDREQPRRALIARAGTIRMTHSSASPVPPIAPPPPSRA